MIFNSFTFFLFFISVFCCYLLLKQKGQNRLLLVASCFFYGCWDYRFLLLLLLTVVVDYSAARLIHASENEKRRKRTLLFSVFVNLGILSYFKYANFFLENALLLLNSIGFHVDPMTLQIILPVGISFYTFQSMSYTIDVFRGRVAPASNIMDYALYVSFFPQLVAGPIERSSHLLPQILSPRRVSWEKIQIGLYYIASGLFLKIFMADNLARLVNPVFAASDPQTGFCYLLTGYAFAFQIYGDFAGYSWIAKGLGAILGFEIMDNFNLPYFSKNPQEFWRRWHISLSSWLRDYLYIPLGGNRKGQVKTVRNLFLTMLLGGLWHGAKMTFVAWGFFHAVLLALHHLVTGNNKGTGGQQGRGGWFLNLLKTIFFFHLIVISWYFFRANSFEQVLVIFNALLTDFHLDFAGNTLLIQKVLFYISPVLLMQALRYYLDDQLVIFRLPIPVRALIYSIAFYLVVIFGVTHAHEFIYFQF
ncbi:MAG: MBOAT family O-acyltransferase [Candidatus Electrothrix sp. GW3-4]|uniref:MBOAT family O-acyltransferase n=1 Tax=Candidatus Electrothrix sp. GW3-4 TaxID=3126740 RepID=UPI0030CB8764